MMHSYLVWLDDIAVPFLFAQAETPQAARAVAHERGYRVMRVEVNGIARPTKPAADTERLKKTRAA